MATTIRELLVAIGVDADSEAIATFDKALDDVKSTMAAVATVAVVVVGAIAGVAASTAVAGDQIAKGAQRTALSVEEYQALAFAAEKAGMGIEQFEASMKLANTKVQQAIKDGKDYIETTNGVRIAITNADGSLKTQQQLLEETAEAVQNAATAQDALAIATSVYGDEAGARMVPMLSQGAEGVKAMAAELEALGGVMSEELTKDSEAFLDLTTDMKTILLGIRNTIGEALLPAINDMMTSLKEWYIANKDLIEQRIEVWAEAVATAIRALAATVEAVDAVVRRLGGWTPILAGITLGVTALVAAFTGLKVLGVINSLLAAFNALMVMLGIGVSVTLGPFVLILAAIAAQVVILVAQFAVFALMIDDFLTYMRGGESVIGKWIEQNREAEGIMGSIARLLEAWLGLLAQVGAVLGALWTEYGAPFVDGFLSGLASVVGYVSEFLLPILDVVAGVLDKITAGLGAITGVWAGIEVPNTEGGELAPGAAAAESGSLAPSQATVGGAGGVRNTSVGGNSYTVNGVGLSREDVEALIESWEAERNREITAAAQGAEA